MTDLKCFDKAIAQADAMLRAGQRAIAGLLQQPLDRAIERPLLSGKCNFPSTFGKRMEIKWV